MGDFIKLRSARQTPDGEMYGEPVGEYTPLIHAHWIIVNCYDGGAKKCKCSNCKGTVKFFENSYKWCPNCGAKMDGKFLSGVSEPPVLGDTAPATKEILYVKYLSGEVCLYSVTSETVKKIFNELSTAGKNYIIFEILSKEEKTNVMNGIAVININNISFLTISEPCDKEADNETNQADKM